MPSVEAWFKRRERSVAQKKKEFVRNARMSLPQVDPAAEADRIKDAVEVIRWDRYFIAAKIDRAISTGVDEWGDPETSEFARQDANGSATIALIAMDRSIAAWSVICQAFPLHADRLLDMFVPLSRLRRDTEQAFPEARKFVRPGSDTRAVP